MIILSFVLILLLIILIIYKCYIHNIKSKKTKNSIVIDVLESGMIGSFPSDILNVYDSKNPIYIPVESHIDDLIDSFKENGIKLYKDLKNNKNSKNYKQYLTDDYKLQLLINKNRLNKNQLYWYYESKEFISRNLNDIFDYHLNKIKYDINGDYIYIKNWLHNSYITEYYIDNIIDYVLNTTDIPNKIIILLMNKISNSAKKMLEKLITLLNYNYINVVNTLEYILNPIFYNNNIKNIKNLDEISKFYISIYVEFTNNNITSYLINLIKLSYMSEDIYYNIISVFLSYTFDNKFSVAVKNIVYKCTLSDFKIINTFPYNFTYILLLDIIKNM